MGKRRGQGNRRIGGPVHRGALGRMGIFALGFMPLYLRIRSSFS